MAQAQQVESLNAPGNRDQITNPEAMTLFFPTDFLPTELVEKTYPIVQLTHKARGLDGLPARIWGKDSSNVAVIGTMPGMLHAVQVATSRFRLQLLCWFGAVAVVALAWIESWRLLMLLVAVAIFERYCNWWQRRAWMLLAAELLSVEMLANDFAGWGEAYPHEQQSARQIMESVPLNRRLDWADYYLPKWRSLDSARLMRSFGPNTSPAR